MIPPMENVQIRQSSTNKSLMNECQRGKGGETGKGRLKERDLLEGVEMF